MAEQQRVWHDLREHLRKAAIGVIDEEAVDIRTDKWMHAHFMEQVFPILTPQALDPAHPFPFIPNKGLSLFFDLVRQSDNEVVQELVILPATLPRFIRVPGKAARYISVETLVRRYSHLLFPGFVIRDTGFSGSCATATSKSRKRPRISSAIIAAPSSSAAAAASSASRWKWGSPSGRGHAPVDDARP